MRYYEIFRILGRFFLYFSFLILFPLCIAVYFEFIELPEAHPQPHSSKAFLLTFFFCIALAIFFRFWGQSGTGLLFRRDSIFLVMAIWILSSFVAALPFYFSGTFKSPLDAYFESMSALTTTGASLMAPKTFDANGKEIPTTVSAQSDSLSLYDYYGTIDPVKDTSTGEVLEGIEAVGRAILVWRSFLQWLGGMGIVVLFLTVLPALGVGGKTLYQTEMTGPVKEGISPRLKETASLLWKLYICLSVLEVSLLLFTNSALPFLDAVCITFSNLSTGGFTLHEESIGYYNNAYTEWIVILFMILGSINFGLYFHVIRMKFRKISKSDFFLFLALILIGSLLTSFAILGTPKEELGNQAGIYSPSDAFRSGIFQWVSAQSSTGYFTANYDLWPLNAQIGLLLAMFFGGMAGSTSGGIKTTRYCLFWKIARNRLEGLFRPETIRIIRFGKIEIDHTTAIMVLLFFCVAFFSSVIGASLFIITGIDLETSVSLISSLINNVGIGFRGSGPTQQINFLSPIAKGLSIFWMLIGRLEYFAILVLFFPTFWKAK